MKLKLKRDARWGIFHNETTGHTTAIKDGWNWLACIFTGVWAMTTKRYVLGAFTIITLLALGTFMTPAITQTDYVLATYVLGAIFAAVMVMTSLLYGYAGNDLNRSRLTKAGYTFVETVVAPSRRSALKAHYIMGNHEATKVADADIAIEPVANPV